MNEALGKEWMTVEENQRIAEAIEPQRARLRNFIRKRFKNMRTTMKRNWLAIGLKVALFAVLGLTVLGFVVMSLWNWLMPALFGFGMITFWQALGLLLL